MEKVLSLRFIGVAIISLKIVLITFIVSKILLSQTSEFNFPLDTQFAFFILAGFVAQIIDGALGMAYGVSCSTLLLSFGLSPVAASASVHTSEVFTTGVSGLSHIVMKNIDKKLFLHLVITGVVGAMLGAYLISEVFDGKMIKPYVSVYLLILGFVILYKALKKKKEFQEMKRIPILGFVGGMLDSIGGGGWGPIVTSNLINKGHSPVSTIGTVNTAEFFVTFFSTGVFLFFTSIEYWQAIAGIIIGGVIAAPLGAMIIRYIQPKTMMILVGLLVVLTSAYNIWKSI